MKGEEDFSFPSISQFLCKARGRQKKKGKSHCFGEWRWYRERRIWSATPQPPFPPLPASFLGGGGRCG